MLTLDQAELAAWPMDHHNERARALLSAAKVSEVLTGRDGRPRQSLNLLGRYRHHNLEQSRQCHSNSDSSAVRRMIG